MFEPLGDSVAAVRHPLQADSSVGAEIEGNWGGYQNRYGVLHIGGLELSYGYALDVIHPDLSTHRVLIGVGF